jgi:hypothetical protein
VELLAEVLPVLVALYVVDSAMLVRAGQVLFVSGWGGLFEARGPGLRLPGLLPFAEALVGARLPLRASADGVFAPAGRGRERLVPFDAMPEVSAEGALVRLGPGTELAVSPPALAPEVARIVERLRTTRRDRRLARLRRELRRRVDRRSLADARARQARMLPVVRLLSGSTFLAIFLLVPASLVAELPRRPHPLAALGVALVLYAATLAASTRLLLDCGVRGRHLLGTLVPLLLFPPAAAHAPSVVLRDLHLGFEPLALARQLLPALALERFERTGRGLSRRDDDTAWDVDALVRDLAALRGGREGPRPLPARRDASASSFCPSCGTEYRAGFERCSDCGEALVPFAAAVRQ